MFILKEIYTVRDQNKTSFMQAKYLCVLIQIWIKGEVGAVKRA